MLNYNGELLFEENIKLNYQNRGFKYGDAIFETVKVLNKKIIFWEDHYFRLMASMRMLRMKIPMSFTLEFLEKEILKTVEVQDKNTSYRVRLTVYRKDGGLFLPTSNKVDYLIEVSINNYEKNNNYKIDIYKDFYNYSGFLSTIKTTNRMINTLASIFANENDLDNCVLINEKKGIVEAIHGNIFLIKGNNIVTPSLSEGCINGVVRKILITYFKNTDKYTIKETKISPFEIQKYDEVFITNSIIGVQPVTNYKKKNFKTVLGEELAKKLEELEIIAS